MPILKHIILNQLIRLPFVQHFARRFHKTGRNGNQEEVNRIFNQLAEAVDFAGKTVLELGPGQTFGILRKVLEAGAKKVVAADIAIYAEAMDAGVDCVLYNGRQLPFPDEFFDIVYSWSVFEHVRHPELVVREMARVTKKGGVSMHSIDLVDHFYYSSAKEECIFHCLKYPRWLWHAMTWHRSNYVNRFRAGDWKKMFFQSGLSCIKWCPDEFQPAIAWYQEKKFPYLNKYNFEDATSRSVYLVAVKSE